MTHFFNSTKANAKRQHQILLFSVENIMKHEKLFLVIIAFSSMHINEIFAVSAQGQQKTRHLNIAGLLQ
jgi:hypothetical protein